MAQIKFLSGRLLVTKDDGKQFMYYGDSLSNLTITLNDDKLPQVLDNWCQEFNLATIAKEIDAGIELLDEHFPFWYALIDWRPTITNVGEYLWFCIQENGPRTLRSIDVRSHNKTKAFRPQTLLSKEYDSQWHKRIKKMREDYEVQRTG